MTKRRKKEDTEILLGEIVKGMQEVRAREIVVIDLRGADGAMTDYFVVCHGSSSTQVEAIARSVEKETLLNLGEKPFHVEGKQNSQWILMDYFNVVVHIFNETTRNYYSLEELWADADFTRYEEVA